MKEKIMSFLLQKKTNGQNKNTNSQKDKQARA